MATLRQLEYLVTIAAEGSFTRAAKVLHLTQPALSHQVRALERSVGGPLLERLPRAVRLTPMGRAMLPFAQATLADAERARRAARQVAKLRYGEVTLATVYSITLGVLPPVLRIWRQQHPEIRVHLHEYPHSDELQKAMAAGKADLAVGPRPISWDGPQRDLGVEEFVVVLAADDTTISPGQTRVNLQALSGHSWVHYSPDNGLADLLDRSCAAAGFQPQASVRTEQTAAAPLLAAAGLGPSLVPANLIPPHFEGRILRPDPPILRQLTAYSRIRPDPLTAAFIDLLASTAQVLPDPIKHSVGTVKVSDQALILADPPVHL